MENGIKEFILRRFNNDSNWLNGNCLWFSLILSLRFPGGNIYYLPVDGHFVYEYNSKYYDWSGEIPCPENKLKLNDLKELDPTWYNRLIRDCFL